MSKQTVSTLDRLRIELGDLEESLSTLVAVSRVEPVDADMGFFVVVNAPDFCFADGDDTHAKAQLDLRSRYLDWYERFSLLYPDPPHEIQERIAAAHAELLNWIDLERNFQIGQDSFANAEASRSAFKPFHRLLSILDGDGPRILVPDTNALIAVPDPACYVELIESTEFLFVLLPTVLSELDNLKNHARELEFRNRVNRVVTRIKGWRNQGSLVDGVTLNKSITVRSVTREPDMDRSLSWLDRDNRDDRIIASILELQSMEPAARLLLITGDVNLQNKADAARLPCSDPPAESRLAAGGTST